MSNDHLNYLKYIKKTNINIKIWQFIILFVFIITWELLSRFNIINSFIFSSPTLILGKLYELFINDNLFIHIFITSYEVIISSIICFILSLLISILLYYNNILKRILDPFIILINSLPKVSLGPLLIIWLGANTNTIIVNSLLISLIVSFNSIINGFYSIDYSYIKLFKVFNYNKYQTIYKLLIPASKEYIFSSIRLNMSLNFIGVIMGEFLSCKHGIGYLILYGTQVFDLSLVMCGINLLLLLSFIFYKIINALEKKL